jgi:hypothetical protein
LIVDRRGQLI